MSVCVCVCLCVCVYVCVCVCVCKRTKKLSLNIILPEPGCSQCHKGITIGDWRDPLDPDLDAQTIFSQFQQGKSTLMKKYLTGR